MLLSVSTGKTLPLSDAILTAFIGILGVFLVLAVLIGLLYLFQTIFKFNVLDKIGGLFKKKSKDEAKSESTVSSVVAQSSDDEDEIVAVICAAISAVYESEGSEVPPFVIRNIKRR